LSGAEEWGRVLGSGAVDGGEGAEGVFLVQELGVQFLFLWWWGWRGEEVEKGAVRKGRHRSDRAPPRLHTRPSTYVQVLRRARGEVQDVAQDVLQDGHGSSLSFFFRERAGLWVCARGRDWKANVRNRSSGIKPSC
jgi:hypothetical protein